MCLKKIRKTGVKSSDEIKKNHWKNTDGVEGRKRIGYIAKIFNMNVHSWSVWTNITYIYNYN